MAMKHIDSTSVATLGAAHCHADWHISLWGTHDMVCRCRLYDDCYSRIHLNQTSRITTEKLAYYPNFLILNEMLTDP